MTINELIADLKDARGNPVSRSGALAKALRSSVRALETGDPKDSAAAGQDYRALNGGEIAIFTKGLKEYRAAQEFLNPGKKENKVATTQTSAAQRAAARAPAPAPAPTGKKPMSQEVKDKLRASKAAPKEPKPEIVYSFKPAPNGQQGTKVFTSHGVGVIRGYDAGNATYQVYNENDEKVYAVSEKSVRWKAFKEEYRDKYTVDKTVKTASGAYSISNGDEVAVAMNGLTTDQLEAVASAAGLAERFEGWADRNPGMQRMNLGNCLRGALKREADAPAAQKAVVMAMKMVRVGPPQKEPKPQAEKPTKPSAQEAMARNAPPAARTAKAGGMKKGAAA